MAKGSIKPTGGGNLNDWGYLKNPRSIESRQAIRNGDKPDELPLAFDIRVCGQK